MKNIYTALIFWGTLASFPLSALILKSVVAIGRITMAPMGVIPMPVYIIDGKREKQNLGGYSKNLLRQSYDHSSDWGALTTKNELEKSRSL